METRVWVYANPNLIKVFSVGRTGFDLFGKIGFRLDTGEHLIAQNSVCRDLY